MSTSKEMIDYILDQLADLTGVRARKMFGEYALYYDEKVVALVCDDQVFVKITPAGRAFVGDNYEEGFPYPSAKPAMLAGGDEIDDSERFCELIRMTAAEIPRPKPKTPRTKPAR